MVRGNIRKHDVVPSKKIRKPKHRRKLPEEISFDASEQEEIEEIGFKISRSKKKRYRHKHSKSNKKESKKSKRKSRSRSRSKTGSDPKGKTSTKSSKSSIPSKTTLSEVEKLEGSNKEISRPKLFQVIDSLRSLDAMQPTQNQIIDLVDSQFRELDLQRSTVSDVYKIVEDHFMTVMSKKNRKVIRHRLIELSSEKTLDQEEKTENAPRLESSLFADDIVSKQDEEILFFIEEQSEDDVGLDQNEKIVSSPNEASNGFRDGRLFAIKKTDKDRHANSGGGRNKSSSRMRHYHPDPHDDYDEVDHESLQYETNLRKKSSKYRRRRTLGMDQSVLSFKNLSLVNGRGRNKKYILKNISGKVKAGDTLTIMGPAGAGKSSLINLFAGSACFGKSSGRVLFNGEALTSRIIKQHAYVMTEHDKHWPYLTCRETLLYAAQLYSTAKTGKAENLVDEIIHKLGLSVCAATSCSRLSAVHCLCLSIGIALIKEPILLFLDNPTKGCDSYAAAKILHEIKRIAREQSLIVVHTIAQPTLRVFESFDQIMILSKGRVSFLGEAALASRHFSEMGYVCPEVMNPAEYFLDVVNPSFSGEERVDRMVDTWEVKAAFDGVYGDKRGEGSDETGMLIISSSCARELLILLRRQGSSMLWDPALYLGRCVALLVTNLFIACMYWKTREVTQEQALNLAWLVIWLYTIPCTFGFFAVGALNNEFKSILREVRNGMFSIWAYIMVKSILVIPVMFLYSALSIGIPGYFVQQFDTDSFVTTLLIFAAGLYIWESIAECYSIWFPNPATGKALFTATFFAALFFGGIFLPLQDMYWPFSLLYYILPLPYCVRSVMYALLIDEEFEPCTESTTSPVCVNSTSGADILDALAVAIPVVSSEETRWMDMLILLAIAIFFKIASIVGVAVKTFEP